MTPFERWAVWSTSLVTSVTGFVYVWMKYFLSPMNEFAVVNHPLQPLVLKIHILVAPLLTFALGLIALRHVWRHVQARLRRGRRTGLTTAAVIGPMIVSGYLIQAVTSEGWLEVLALVHIATGAVYFAAVALHQLFVRHRAAGDTDADEAPPRRRAVATAAGAVARSAGRAPAR